MRANLRHLKRSLTDGTSSQGPSLYQELWVIERVNEWLGEGHLPKSDFSRTEIHRIPMGRAYHCPTKVDRRPAFIRELMELGERRAAEFYEAR